MLNIQPHHQVIDHRSCTPIGGRRALTDNFSFNFSLVEVAVAATGGTSESSRRALRPARHELPATVHRVSSHVGCVILLALSVSHTPHCHFLSSHYYLTLPHRSHYLITTYLVLASTAILSVNPHPANKNIMFNFSK